MSCFIRNYESLLSSDDELETTVTAFSIEDSLDDGIGSRSQTTLGNRRRMFIRRRYDINGMERSHNDINVLKRFDIFAERVEGCAPKVNYSINGHNYTMGYYLADGIYPPWSTFVKTSPAPQGPKRQLFASALESERKDVERAFGVLQAHFVIVRGSTRYFCQEALKDIMISYIILHKMIVEDERDTYLRANDSDYDQADDINLEPISRYLTTQFVDFLQHHRNIRNKETHSQLQFDLIEHQWKLLGEQ